jgi:serine phosphatase RsbU (regulator of sigma subunit)
MEVALCRFDLKNKRLQFSGAFCPIFMIRENSLHHIIGDNMPIGIYDDEERKFSSSDLALKKNDIIYLFTDGYVDQIGSADRKTFKTNRFKELLLDIFRLPMSEQKQVLERKIEEWKGELEQIDDILVLGIKIID